MNALHQALPKAPNPLVVKMTFTLGSNTTSYTWAYSSRISCLLRLDAIGVVEFS